MAAVLAEYPNFDAVVVKTYIKVRTIARMRFENLRAEGLLSINSTADTGTLKRLHEDDGSSKNSKRSKINEKKKKPVNKSYLKRKYKKLSSK